MKTKSMDGALTGPHNSVHLGATQTGKTSTARELHAESPRVSIWVNERGDDRVPNVAGTEARSLEGVKRAFSRDEWKVNFLPADRNEALPELRSWLWSVAERTNRELPVQVVVDEVDRAAPQTQEKDVPHRDAVRTFTGEGVKRNIKFVGITQHPQQYDKESLRNSRYRLVWEMSNEAQKSVSDYGFNFNRVRDAEQYEGIVHYHDGDVLGTVKAAGRYA